MKYEILAKEVVEKGDDWRLEVQLCIAKKWDSPQIRICYYKKMQHTNGKMYWNLVPRAPSFPPASSIKVAKAMQEVSDTWNRAIEAVKRVEKRERERKE